MQPPGNATPQATTAGVGPVAADGRRMSARLLPLALTALLCLATFAVWRMQVDHQRRLVVRHTEDVGGQAARRLETFVDAQLSTAGVLARHWSQGTAEAVAEHGRFEGLASLLLAEFPGFHGLAIVDANGLPIVLVVESDSSVTDFLASAGDGLLSQASSAGDAVVSDPVPSVPGKVSFFAAWPVAEGAFLLVEYRVDELIDDCFHGQIRAEFNYALEDDGETLFRFAAADEPPLADAAVASVHAFPVRNRQWRLTVAPRAETIHRAGWRPDWSVPALGLLLSVGVGLLVHMLQVRMDRYRVSEARYHGVFASATDGLLVLDADGTVLDGNPAACRLLGRDLETLRGTHLGRLLSGGSRQLIGELAAGLDGGERTLRLDAAVTDRDGRSVEVELRASSFVHQGRPAILTILTDVSERRTAARRQAVLAQRALVAQEEERTRVARDLHDDLGQLLTGLRLELDYTRRRDPARTPDLETADGLVARAVDSVRRLCRGLRPPLLDDLGLESSLRQLVGEFSARNTVEVELGLEIDEEARPISTDIGLCAYRVLQEALTNVSRHAHARRVTIGLNEEGDELVLRVEDDGLGFDTTAPGGGAGLGISGMHERVRLVDGVLHIHSAAGEGTTVVARLPAPPSSTLEAS